MINNVELTQIATCYLGKYSFKKSKNTSYNCLCIIFFILDYDDKADVIIFP